MDPDVPLVVSEVNPEDAVRPPKGIIANPNCTTMAAMPVLAPLHRAAGLPRLRVATYQAVSGSGGAGVGVGRPGQGGGRAGRRAGLRRSRGRPSPSRQVRQADRLQRASAGGLDRRRRSGETDEEQKLRNESRKILHIPELLVAGTCVRVPVFTGHRWPSTPSSPNDGSCCGRQRCWPTRRGSRSPTCRRRSTPPARTPAIVGRIRADQSAPPARACAVRLKDNLRKGAALNAVQIAELIGRSWSASHGQRA